MRQDTNDTRRKNTYYCTCWTVADDRCTDEGTRRRETYGDTEGEIRKVGSKAQEHENSTQGLLLQSRAGDLVTLYATFFLFPSTALFSVTTAAVDPALREQNNEKQTKLTLGRSKTKHRTHHN